MTATAAAAPVPLVDVEDLADADLRDELDERLDAGGRVLRADAVALAVAVRREARAAVVAHALDSRAGLLVADRQSSRPGSSGNGRGAGVPA